MKIAVITAIFGDIDIFRKAPPQNIPNVDFFYCHANNTLGAPEFHHPRLQAKYYKICAHKLLPGYDAYVWLDGCLEIISDRTIKYLVNELGNNDFLIQRHFSLNCIYEEEKLMLGYMMNPASSEHHYISSRYTIDEIKNQVDAYRPHVKPESGYWLGGLFIRRNNEAANMFFDEWWNKIMQYGVRDQFSLAYLILTMKGIKIKHIKDILYTDMIKYHRHIK